MGVNADGRQQQRNNSCHLNIAALPIAHAASTVLNIYVCVCALLFVRVFAEVLHLQFVGAL